MKKMIWSACFLCFLLQSNTVSAKDPTLFSQRLMIKNRARTRAKAHLGRVEYHYEDIRDLKDSKGELLVDSSVKKLYSYTKVTASQIKTYKEAVEIGNIEAEGKLQHVSNIVEVQGDVTSLFAPINIGNISLQQTGGEVENTVNIKGNVEAK